MLCWFLCVYVLSCVRLFQTTWIVAGQTPLSMRFPRQEYRSGLPFLSPGDLPDPRIEPTSLSSPALAGRFFTIAPPGSLCQFLLHNKVNQLYIYIHPLFLGFPSHLDHHRVLSRVPCAISFMQISVYICQSQPPNSSHQHPFLLGIPTFVLYICISKMNF